MHGDIVVPSHRTDWGLRSFAVAGPSSWNALPVDLRSSSFGLDTFAKHLKTHLFGYVTLYSVANRFSNLALMPNNRNNLFMYLVTSIAPCLMYLNIIRWRPNNYESSN